MAFTQDSNNSAVRAYSVGPIKQQIISGTIGSTDTAIALTFSGLAEVRSIVVTGAVMSAAPTFATNVATLTFTAPGATVYISAIGHGV